MSVKSDFEKIGYEVATSDWAFRGVDEITEEDQKDLAERIREALEAAFKAGREKGLDEAIEVLENKHQSGGFAAHQAIKALKEKEPK
jgi:flagellar biosynthesis/type III secretory pathway protein FliH